MKKILIFIDWFAPGFKAGGPIRSVLNLVENLNENFLFYIFTRNTDYMSHIPYTNVPSNKWYDYMQNVKVFYCSKENLKITTMLQTIQSIAPDLVYINGIFSLYYSIIPLLISKKIKIKTVISPRGMLSKQTLSRKRALKKLFFSITKKLKLYSNISFIATNDEEKNDILRICKNCRIEVLPNLPRKIEKLQDKNIQKFSNELKLISIARISQEKNTLGAIKILKYIDLPNVSYDLYGTIYDYKYWQACQKEIAELKHATVNYKGPIESIKVLECFSKYHFSLMPSIAENYGHSIIESLMAGTPVITSSNTPWKDLEDKNCGWAIELENQKKFEEVLKKIYFMDQNNYQTMSREAIKYALTVSNNELKTKYQNFFENVIEN